MEALVAATSNASRCLDMSGEVGTIEAGKCADLVFVDGNPLDHVEMIQDLQHVPLVLKAGRVVANRLAAPPSTFPRGPQRAAATSPGG